MFKGEITLDKDGNVEGDELLLSIIQRQVLLDPKKEVEIEGNGVWCG
jgi:hypothetical protein